MKKRPGSDRPKMPLGQRAKQFAPFDALTGLSERLRQAEEEHRLEKDKNTVRLSGEGFIDEGDIGVGDFAGPETE